MEKELILMKMFWDKLKQIENGKSNHATILPNHLISDEEKANKKIISKTHSRKIENQQHLNHLFFI